MVRFTVTTDWQVSDQYVSNRIARTRIRATPLRQFITANRFLIFDVMTEVDAHFQVVGAHHFRKVILPDEEILVILPRRLVPQSVIAASGPESGMRGAFCPWEDRGK